jgi:hypothetical protein
LDEPNFGFERRDIIDEGAAVIADETSRNFQLKRAKVLEFVNEIRARGSPGEFR